MRSPVTTGTVVAGFRIESPIGEGAMGAVYLAEDREGRRVALKLLSPELARDERFRQRFLRESQLATSLDHPHIVPTVAYGEEDGTLYLAMAYVDGSDLRDLLRRESRLEPERAIEIVGQIAEALDAAHAAGLVHRDVKPGNILLEREGEAERAYVCDFGLARHVTSVSSLTGERGFVGTIDYVPPEQIEGGPIDRRADIYSLGCVLFECLAGQRPFERDSELSVVFAHLNEPPPRLTDLRPELPETFDQVFQIALAKSPDDRYSSCGELAAAARAAQHGRVLARRRPRRHLLAAAAAILAAAGAATGAVLLTGGGSGNSPTTITADSILGARLGDSNELISRLWGGGLKLGMQTPPDYSVITQRTRNVSAYFIGTTDKAVEITTWNKADRTAAGIGPCSTLADLRRVYGKQLKPVPNSTHGNLVGVWLVGKHLLFSMGPAGAPTIVEAVGIHNNNLGWAAYNVTNDGPCAPAANDSPVARPTTLPAGTKPKRTTIVSREFTPRLTIQAPAGWRLQSDTRRRLRLGSQAGVTMDFALDPAASANGSLLSDVSDTPQGLTAWLRKSRMLKVSTPRTVLLGHPALTVTALSLTPSAHAPPSTAFLGFPDTAVAFPARIARGSYVRLYLSLVRLGSVVHTLAVAVTAPSAQRLQSVASAAEAIVFDLKVKGVPVVPLSRLSSTCTPVFFGTCVGELSAGTHRSSTFQPALTYTVPLGWTNFTDHPGAFGLVPPHSDWAAVDSGLSDYIDAFTSIATGVCGDGPGTVHTPDGFLRWIGRQPGFAPIQPRAATIGGLSGYVVDLRMRDASVRPCPGGPGQPVLTGLPPSPDGLNHWIGPGSGVMRLYLLNYKDGTLGIEITEVAGSSKLAAYSDIVKTFRFAPG